jgi:hypothetical protein
MNSALTCLAVLAAAALTALVPAEPPAAVDPATPPAAGPAPADSLATWRDRATRAEAWLKAKAANAEQAANEALARARKELLGEEAAPVAAPTLAIATRITDTKPVAAAGVWLPLTEAPKTFAGPETHVVLLVHGLDEPGTIWDELTPHLLDRGATVIRFDYPNDQGLTDSATALLAHLKHLRGLGVERVSIVAHSMGGLVGREALTSAYGYAGDAAATKDLPAVSHLIMCGTPNHGSPLASLQAIAEAREQVVRRVQGTAAHGSGLVGFAGDGCGEAGRDLCEGSEFLTSLNSRPLPSNVSLTTICGRVTPEKACEFLRNEASGQWASYLGSDRAAALTAQACAVVETLGDGMVPVESTRLEGVSDHVEIAADHRSMLKRWTILVKLDELRGLQTPPAEAIPVILDRLGLAPVSPPDETKAE